MSIKEDNLTAELHGLRQQYELLKEEYQKHIARLEKVECDLRESTQNYRTLADSGEVLVWASGLDKPCHYFNKTWLEFTGRTLQQEENDGWLEGVHPDDVYRCVTLYNDAYQRKEKFSSEYRLRRHDGEYRWIHDIATPSYNSKGDFIGYVGQCSDITEAKNAKEEIVYKNAQLVQLNAEKDRLFSVIAHDLRGPFNGFLGLTQIMSDDLMNMSINQIHNIVVNMSKSANNLYRLLDNLLQWSMVQQGIITFVPSWYLMHDVVDENLSSLQEMAKNKGVQLNVKVGRQIEVYADKYMLQSIIRNLVSNAIKFTPAGGNVSIECNEKPEGIKVYIEDTGVGMPVKIRENLFDIKTITSRLGTDNEPSVGLGLVLCKDFVEKHGGVITVVSDEDRGSCFTFSLPFPAK